MLQVQQNIPLPMKFVGWFCYRGARVITWCLATFMWRMKVTGAENLDIEQPFLLCPVHRSNVDGPLTCVWTRRRMRYLAKESMFDWAPTAKIYTAMGAIEVNRGTPDRQSLHRCLTEIEAGYPLVLFPEGTRKGGDVIEELNEGAVYIALRAGVPIIPVGISGSSAAMPIGARFLHFAKIKVVVGKPIFFPQNESGRTSRSAIREGTAKLKIELQRLYDEAREAPSNKSHE